MTQLWRVRESKEPTGAQIRWRVIPLDACIQKFGLSKAHLVKEYPEERVLPVGPSFGQIDNDPLAEYRDPIILVIEIESEEAQANGWTAGFYRAPISLAEADKLLAETHA
jgi:hypothetical protein